MAHLFVIDLTYISDLEKVEEHMQAHRDFLGEHYASGMFLASGRKEPRIGGVILAQGKRSEVEAAVAADPFSIHGVARYVVTEFIPTMTGDALASFKE